MAAAYQLLVLILFVVTGACCAKLAAFIFKRARLSWTDSFLLAALVTALSFIVGLLFKLLLPEGPPGAIALPAFAAAGCWFLKPRMRSADGAPTSWAATVGVVTLAAAMFFAVIYVVFLIVFLATWQ